MISKKISYFFSFIVATRGVWNKDYVFESFHISKIYQNFVCERYKPNP